MKLTNDVLVTFVDGLSRYYRKPQIFPIGNTHIAFIDDGGDEYDLFRKEDILRIEMIKE